MKHFLWSLAVAAFSIAGCDLAPDEEVDVLLPAPPAAWQIAFPRMGYRIVTRDGHNRLQEATAADWRTPVTARCAREVSSPVLAYPLEGSLRPAGGFSTLSLREYRGREALELTWRDGAAALVVARLADLGRNVSLFNVPRLRQFLAEADDPWDVDLDAVAQKIAQGGFTAWDIDRLPSRDAEVGPGAGTWFLESPFSALQEAENGRIRLSGISLGCHMLFSLDGRRWRLEVGNQETFLVDYLQTVKSTPSAP
jgi:hypothetical protein